MKVLFRFIAGLATWGFDEREEGRRGESIQLQELRLGIIFWESGPRGRASSQRRRRGERGRGGG